MINEAPIKNTLPVPGLYGLVVCGGNSLRMGSDKSMLVYHKKPQRYHLYEMLQLICEKVFISCNAEQAEWGIDEGYQTLIDLASCKDIGPMAAVVTAIIHHPKNNFLIVGCDYPFLSAEELHSFIFSREEETCAAFYNDMEQVYEPLIAFFHEEADHRLMKMYATGQYSLQQFLKNEGAFKYHPANRNAIKSVDTKHEYLQAKRAIDLTPGWKLSNDK